MNLVTRAEYSVYFHDTDERLVLKKATCEEVISSHSLGTRNPRLEMRLVTDWTEVGDG